MFVSVTAAVRGCYAVLDRDDEALARALVEPGRGGARVLQVRLKDAASPASLATWVAVATMARRVTRAAGAALVVDDHLDVALAVGADGVHLGQHDLPLVAARAAVAAAGRPLWIGVSTHDLAQVGAAVAGGADYLGFGPVFPTATKANPDPVVGLTGLAAAVAAAGSIPVVAIGGITPATAGEVAATGAASACVVRAVNKAADVAAAVRAIAAPWASAAVDLSRTLPTS
ncbi:MAG: thiamine phosphate synthase [Kofleriaceae bacterium]